jgi:hypothetical protein
MRLQKDGLPDRALRLEFFDGGLLLVKETQGAVSYWVAAAQKEETGFRVPTRKRWRCLRQARLRTSGYGAITGPLGFPSEYVPPLRIVAFNLDTKECFWVDTEGDESYRINRVSPGRYQVMAYDIEQFSTKELKGLHRGKHEGAGYTEAIECGWRQFGARGRPKSTAEERCEDHSLITFDVLPGATKDDISPNDWADLDGVIFPADPTWTD